MVKSADTNRSKKIVALLKKEYPEARTALHHENPLQLLVATILSAQCTDERVNKVTPALFARYKNAKDFAEAKPAELEKMIRSTGFFKNKTKSIIGCCKGLVENHGGKVPASLDDLVKLPGIGRKTANVVLGSSFGVPGIVVDTHVKRLTGLLGLTKNTDPVKIEFDLMEVIPKKDWTIFSHLLIYHGRKICIARRPRCCECVLKTVCPSNNCE